jgi:soluble lytic murein transglycosylase-like protein
MATTFPLHTLGAYGIDLRPRGSRHSAPLPLAFLALAALGAAWCFDLQRRRLTGAASLVFLALLAGAPLVAGSGLPHVPVPQLAFSFPSSTVADTWPPTFRTPYLPSLAVPARSVRPEPAAAPPQPAALPEPVTAPPARAAWQPSNAATFSYPSHIEAWRPLVRQLLAEAWDEGRLDGPASRIDDDLILALIRQESQGDPNAESWVGAIGLMQVMPFTFADVMAGDRSLTCAIDPAAMWDVPSNVRAGLRYLALAMNAQNGNVYWALASYNAGIDTVGDWRTAGLYAVPPAGGYWETADYAQRILRDYLSRRPDVAPLIQVPDPMPQAHVPGALRLLQDLDSTRGGPRPKEWIPYCGR